MIAVPMLNTRARRLLSRLLDAITQKRASGVMQDWCGFGPSLPVRDIGRFPMLAAEKRLLTPLTSCDHEDIETRSLPKSEFIVKRKN
jgi:hypothetical protein